MNMTEERVNEQEKINVHQQELPLGTSKIISNCQTYVYLESQNRQKHLKNNS